MHAYESVVDRNLSLGISQKKVDKIIIQTIIEKVKNGIIFYGF